MENIREKLRIIINDNLMIEFTDHESMVNPAKFKGTLKIVNAKIEDVLDKILVVIEEGKEKPLI